MEEHYKQFVITNSALGNKIYLGKKLKDGLLGSLRKDVTEEVLGTTMLHMKKDASKNGRAIYAWQLKDELATVAYIPEKLKGKFMDWCKEVGYENKNKKEK